MHVLRIFRRLMGALASVGLCVALSACGQVQVTAILSGAPEGPTIAIGVAADEPGLGFWHDGSYEGFDIEVAKYVAAKLGYANKQIVYKQVRPENRQSQLLEGNVDMVVASWPITEKAKQSVAFAGPYLHTGYGLLVRSEETGQLAGADNGIGQIDNRVICSARGDETADLLKSDYPDADVQARDSYAQCVTALQVGSADAIVGDTVMLAGLRAANGPEYSTVLHAAKQDVLGYGIAVIKDNAQLAQKITDALADMSADGSLAHAADELEQRIGMTVRVDSDM